MSVSISSSMATRLIPFNLGKLVLDHDMSQDLELQSGDVITIHTRSLGYSTHPSQNKPFYVELAGEFVHPGVYSVAAFGEPRCVPWLRTPEASTGRALSLWRHLRARALVPSEPEATGRICRPARARDVQRDGLGLGQRFHGHRAIPSSRVRGSGCSHEPPDDRTHPHDSPGWKSRA